jgi:glucokinase
MEDFILLGADIGGSHITVAIIDAKKGQIVEDSIVRSHVDPHGAVDEIIEEWSIPFQTILSKSPAKNVRIGLAMPGPFDYEKGISYIKGLSKYEALYGLNVKELLAKRLGIDPSHIRMMNDAACFLQGEMLAGTAGQVDHAIGITLGTGIGTARYHDGVAQDADLWKHPHRGTIIEEFVSTRWFVKRYQELTGNSVKDVKEIIRLTDGTPLCDQLFSEFSDSLSQFLVYFTSVDKPEAIVVGGNISKASSYFLPKVIALLEKHSVRTPFMLAKLGENAAILGACASWRKELIN